MNLYAYVGDDPINKTDPTGECGFVGAGAGIVIEMGVQMAENHLGTRQGYSAKDAGVAALSGAACVGLIKHAKNASRYAKIGKGLLELGLDGTKSAVTQEAKEKEVTAEGVVADVIGGKAGEQVGKSLGKLAANLRPKTATSKMKERARFPGFKKDKATLKAAENMDKKADEGLPLASGVVAGSVGSTAAGSKENEDE